MIIPSNATLEGLEMMAIASGVDFHPLAKAIIEKLQESNNNEGYIDNLKAIIEDQENEIEDLEKELKSMTYELEICKAKTCH